MTEKLLKEQVKNEDQRKHFIEFIHDRSADLQAEQKTVDDAQAYYMDDKAMIERVNERA